ncbi:MAG: DUF6314 family protein, partial [Anaerolineae bacterium]
MLGVLCGSKTMQKILLFLFVNGKCYGTQLHRLLQTPLTPIQKALFRLEKAGIIASEHEGKTRLYRFNPAFPLLTELELLLKKAYTLLPPQDKRSYCFIKHASFIKHANSPKHEQLLLTFWERLSFVKNLTFNAKTKSKEESGWDGKGKGEVLVTKESDTVLIFNEKGSWQDKHGKEINFSNIFRWTLEKNVTMISLEHLRRGPTHPVFLFSLSPSSPHSLSSIDSHFCEEDTYFGQVFLDPHYLRLNWRVIGPKKNEEID